MPAPLLTLIFPVYNGAESFERAFTSNVDQLIEADFDVEILISNNASTDDTDAVCRKLIKRYKKHKNLDIHYTLQDENIGLYENYDYLYAQATGKYMAWPSHDDERLDGFFIRAVKHLEKHSDTAVVHGHIRVIGNKTGQIMRYHTGFGMGLGDDQQQRFLETVVTLDASPIHGVFRKSSLDQTTFFRALPGGDHLLLNELSLYGKFHGIQDITLDYYEDEDKFSAQKHLQKIGGRRFFFQSRWICENIRSVFLSPLTLREKARLALKTLAVQRRLILRDLLLLVSLPVHYARRLLS